MKYPGIDFFNDGIDVSSISSSISLMTECIVQIVHEDEVYNRADTPRKNLRSGWKV